MVHTALLTLLITDRFFTRSGRKGSRKKATRAVRATRRFRVTLLLLSSSSFRAAFGGFTFLGFSGSLHAAETATFGNTSKAPGPARQAGYGGGHTERCRHVPACVKASGQDGEMAVFAVHTWQPMLAGQCPLEARSAVRGPSGAA